VPTRLHRCRHGDGEIRKVFSVSRHARDTRRQFLAEAELTKCQGVKRCLGEANAAPKKAAAALKNSSRSVQSTIRI
jgi:hypothetical protein